MAEMTEPERAEIWRRLAQDERIPLEVLAEELDLLPPHGLTENNTPRNSSRCAGCCSLVWA